MLRLKSLLFFILIISNYGYAKTYKELFLEGNEEITSDEGKACVRKVQEALKAGHDLRIPEIRDYVHLISEEKFSSGKSDLLFYHYTDSRKARNNADDNTPEKQFDFLRTINDHAWYVAEDPFSSEGYGRIQVRIHIKQEKFILSGQHTDQVYQLILNRIKQDFGDSCVSSRIRYSAESFLPLLFLELNDISLIDYFLEQKWYRLMSEDGIEKIGRGQRGQW